MRIAIADEVHAVEENDGPHRGGLTRRQWLLTGEAADGLRFRLFRSHYQGGDNAFQSPRHHHAFQQIRWAEAGSVNYGPAQDIPQGDLAYFPRGAYYGPQLKDQGVSFLLQFGFGSELRGRDPNRAYRDGTQTPSPAPAAREASDKRATSVIPAEGYDAPILIHPQAFTYYGVEPGIEMRHFGRFYDHAGPRADVRLSMARISAGATLPLGDERAQVGWTISPGLQVDGRSCPPLTSFYSARGEESALTAMGTLELFLVEFPLLD